MAFMSEVERKMLKGNEENNFYYNFFYSKL